MVPKEASKFSGEDIKKLETVGENVTMVPKGWFSRVVVVCTCGYLCDDVSVVGRCGGDVAIVVVTQVWMDVVVVVKFVVVYMS